MYVNEFDTYSMSSVSYTHLFELYDLSPVQTIKSQNLKIFKNIHCLSPSESDSNSIF